MNRKEREKNLHDQLADNYESIREKQANGRYYSLEWIRYLLGLLPNKPYVRILDLGCGTAIAYEIVRNKFPQTEYIGVDLSERMIDAGKRKYPGVDLRVMDCENLEFSDGSFDVIIARSILHHVPNPERSLREIKRVLVGDGVVVISEPHRNVFTFLPREILKMITGKFDKEHTNFTTSKIRSLFVTSGMRLDGIHYFGYLAYPFAFPDIIKVFKYFPFKLFKFLFRWDLFLSKIPVLNRAAWHIIIVGTKELG
ncbi:MAG TPA: class I SAM-dependent methyltransferase [bacterium]|nr:class I SAM-dependent methyltransferase [bacterium]